MSLFTEQVFHVGETVFHCVHLFPCRFPVNSCSELLERLVRFMKKALAFEPFCRRAFRARGPCQLIVLLLTFSQTPKNTVGLIEYIKPMSALSDSGLPNASWLVKDDPHIQLFPKSVSAQSTTARPWETCSRTKDKR